MTLPWESVVAGLLVFVVGVLIRWSRRAVKARRDTR